MMTELKKSLKGAIAAISMSTLALLATGCNPDKRTERQKNFDAAALQVMSNPNRAFSDEIDDKQKGNRAIELNKIFTASEFIIAEVESHPKKFIRDAVNDALVLARQQGRLAGSVYDVEFLANYTPNRTGNTDTAKWIEFFRKSAAEARQIQSEEADKAGAIPKTWTGTVWRRTASGFWRETKSLSDYMLKTMGQDQKNTLNKKNIGNPRR